MGHQFAVVRQIIRGWCAEACDSKKPFSPYDEKGFVVLTCNDTRFARTRVGDEKKLGSYFQELLTDARTLGVSQATAAEPEELVPDSP